MKYYKFFLITIVLFKFNISYGINIENESLFISKTDATVLAISGTISLMIPEANAQLLQTAAINNLQLQANSGVMLPAINRRNEYITANLLGRQKIAEQIGDYAARQYAKMAGYQTIFQGIPGQGKGFDQVYRNKIDNQIIVIEAKGGSSQLKQYYGSIQGSKTYTLIVAEKTLANSRASIDAKQAAKEVLKAYREDRLVIQVVKTQHVLGKPQTTEVITTYGEVKLPNTLKVANHIGSIAGISSGLFAGGINLITQLFNNQQIDFKQTSTITALGGLSGYAGGFTATLVQHELLTSQTKLLINLTKNSTAVALMSGVTGGILGGTIFSYGSYLLGYNNEKNAGRETIANIAAYSTWAGASALISGAVALKFATSIAGIAGAAASTGTSIAGLHGIAAANATLAWLGGGSLASGGGGIAAGSTLLAGMTATGIGILALGVGSGIMYLYHINDKNAEQERVAYLLKKVKESFISS